MKVELTKEQEEKIINLLKVTDEGRKSVISNGLNHLAQELLLPLKPAKINSGIRHIDFSRTDKDETTKPVKQLQEILKLTKKLQKKINCLDDVMLSRLSEHIGLRLSTHHFPTPTQHRMVRPSILLDSIYDSASDISDDFSQAYIGKWDKFFSEMTEYWELSLHMPKPTIYLENPFFEFLSIISNQKKDTLFTTYKRYLKKQGTKP
jgi:hypothetical protein